MTDLLPIETDTTSMETDPVGYMTTVLYRAKSWLAEAQSIDDVRHTKAIAVGYESVIREKEMAFDAQLSATEIVRRCERRVGELVRAGQEEGTVRPPSQTVGRVRSTVADSDDSYGNTRGYSHHDKPTELADEEPRTSPAEYFNTHKEQTDSYALADASPEDFDQALEEAKAEGNLSRANVVRKVEGETLNTAPGTAARAKPLTDQFGSAVDDLTKATARITRLVDDKRFGPNSDTIAVRYRSDFVRARDALQGVIDRLSFSLEEG
ncbi:MAG: hypothetical protein ACYCU8_08200 [Ferrimicrobium acidiphilum]